METKICKECGIEKEINEYTKYRKYGKEYTLCICKKCKYKRIKAYRENNKEVLKEKRKLYYKNNKEVFEKYKERYKEKRKETLKNYYDKNKEKIRQKIKECHQKYKPIRKIKERERRKKDKIYRLKLNVRLMINKSFKRKNKSKSNATEKILCCDIDFFVKYLLQTFKDNYGYEWDGIEKVHIDHIIPLATANNEEEIIKLCHYTNLQLLKAKDNMQKKR